MKKFKLLRRLFVVFGISALWAVSGWGITHTDVSITKTAPATVVPNTALAYTITVKNVDTHQSAGTIRVVDTLPTGVTYVSGSGTNWTCTRSGQTVTCDLSGTLGANTTAGALTINTTSPSTVGSITNNAVVSMTDSSSTGYDDTNTSDNTASAVTTVQYSYTASNERDFTQQYTKNTIGDIKLIGNTVLCKSSVQSSSYKTGACTAPLSTDSNDVIYTLYHKLASDTNSSIFNSSSSDLTIPAGSTVLWATLYWQGGLNSTTIAATTGDATLTNMTTAMNKAQTVLFKSPDTNGSYISVTSAAGKFNWNNNAATYNYYQGAADVTQYVKQSGTYQLANLIANDGNSNGGTGPYGGWSLMVVYEDLSSGASKLKNMVVYDGYKLVNSDVTKTLSGFLTPLSGVVDSKFTMFAAEADSTRTDTISMKNSAGTFVTVAANELASTIIGADGLAVTTRTPSYGNTIGTDIHTWNVGTTAGAKNIIGNNQTTTDVKFTYGTDIYNLGVFAFSTDLYEPDVCYVENIFKGTTNISGVGAQVNKDDNLTVRVYIKNKGTETASGVRILHKFDSSFPYVVNSANYNNTNPTYETVMPPSYTRTTATDSSGNDLYEYNSTSLVSKINLGIGATATSGGTFNTTSSASPTYAVFEYNAAVKILDNNYSNVYQVGYINSVLGIDYTNNPVTMHSCDGSKNSFYGYAAPVAASTIDAVDTYSSATYTDANGPDIQTKVASTPNVTLQAVWLGSTNTPQAYSDTTYDTAVIMRLSNSACSTDENLTNSATGVVATFVKNTTPTAVTSNSFTVVPNARPNAKVRLSYVNWTKKFQDASFNCANSNNDATLLGVPACLASATQIEKVFGTATMNACSVNGARPACNTNSYNNTNVPSYPYDNAYGCYQCLAGLGGQNTCSTDSFAIRPKDFYTNLTAGQLFVAKQPAGITIQARDYSSVATGGYNETENSSFKGDVNISDTTKTCAQSSITFSPNINFTEGSATGNYSFGNVGDFNVTIHEINGTEFAHVDFDDTSDTNRIITPFTQQIKIIPAHFAVDGNLTNGSNGFTYLSNFQDYNTTASRNISAGLDLNVTAQAFDNNVTTNYTGTCYAKDGNISVAINPFAMTPVGAVTKMIWYEKNHDTNGSMGIPVNSFVLPVVRTAFDTAGSNGTARVNYKLNFDRSQTKTVDPRSMVVTNVTVTDADAVTGAKVPTTNSAYYVYGRVIPRGIRTFGSGAFAANGWYEVFNTTAIGATAIPGSKNDPLWSASILHNDVNDGNSDVTVVVTGATPANASAVNGVETYSFGGGYALGGYKAHIRTAPWLWYGASALPYLDPANPANLDCLTHPCFNINVVPSIGATGSSNTVGSKTNKITTKAVGGWHSSSDYSPAIR